MTNMPDRTERVLVVTTINPPTATVERTRTLRPDWGVTVVGDARTPADWRHDGVRFLSLQDQQASALTLAEALPTGHYSRKNLGYLDAIARGAEVIAETDDDNFPKDDFLEDVSEVVRARAVTDRGWVNVYRCFTDEPVWPRGFHLEHVSASLAARPSLEAEVREHRCPVQQFLADGDPDVDAIHRLVFNRLFDFERGDDVVLPPGAHCPFNSQNTVWFPEAYALLYLPSTVSFRMTDIWRSFVAARCLAARGLPIAFRRATVHQDRNVHRLLRDFEGEVSGYLHNGDIVEALTALDLDGEDDAANLRACYRRLHELDHVAAAELDLLERWLVDLDVASQRAAASSTSPNRSA